MAKDELTNPEAVTAAPSSSRLTREEEADWDLRHTRITPGAAVLLCLTFLALILAVPIWQQEYEAALARAPKDPNVPAPPRVRPQDGLQVFAPDVKGFKERLRLIRGPRSIFKYGLFGLLPEEPKIRAYEHGLEEGSVVRAVTLPYAQLALTGLLGTGNRQCLPGKDGWIFYEEDVLYLTAAGFFPANDPASVFADAKKQLAAHGIELVIVLMPVKSMIYPEEFATFGAPTSLPQNPVYEPFMHSMQEKGVTVFDVGPVLYEAKKRHPEVPLWLKTDTHYSPAAMEMVASSLADFLREKGYASPSDPVHYSQKTIQAEATGDIIKILKLPAGQKIYPPERYTLHQVLTPDGKLWESTPTASILVIGDSFCNIYSHDDHGSNAGLGEHLSADLGQPLDKIQTIGGGMERLRATLEREGQGTPSRLKGKRVVVWELVMRDLAWRDWTPVDFSPVLHDVPLATQKDKQAK